MISETLKKKAKEIRGIFFDFDGVFTDNRVLVFQDGSEGVFCNRGDGIGLEKIRRLGIQVMVISKEKNPVVAHRCQKLGISSIQGCDDKGFVLKKEVQNWGISLSQIAFLGNDINDLECMKMVGLPACVSDAYPEVLAVAEYVTSVPGGKGAVREFCDLIVHFQKS